MKRNLFLLLFLFLMGAQYGFSAQYAVVDGITYQLNPNTHEAVLYSGESCKGELSIPSEVSYGGRKYAVTSIAYAAFAGDGALTSVNIPGSVTTIGQSSFHDCSNLTSVVIREGAMNIEADAFRNCSRLTDISIPISVCRIGGGAFEGTAWYINQPDGLVYAGKVVYKYKGTVSIYNYILIKEGTCAIASDAFRNCDGMVDIYIPEGVTEIGDYAFCGCSGLTFVWFPQSTTNIGDYAFYGCVSLRSVTIHGNIRKVGLHAFENCSSLGSVKILDGMTYISDYLFSGCTNLETIIIPNSVEDIGIDAFSGCSHLRDVYCYADNVPFSLSNPFKDSSYSSATLHVLEGCVSNYKKASPWSGFGTIMALKPNIEINENNFPDENFRKYLLSQWYGTDGQLMEVEIDKIDYIGVEKKNIQSLKGIEYFYALTELKCRNNNLTSLDLSKNTQLTELDCRRNQLASLDLTKNAQLTELDCGGNQLTSLDLSKNTSLTLLYCHENNLSELDLSKNTSLKELYCYVNKLSKLDLSKNTLLTRAYCFDNQLITLNVSGCSSLGDIYCNNNQLSTLNVSDCTALLWLRCDQNQIQEAGMDALIENLPIVNFTALGVNYAVLGVINETNDQNVMTTIQVEAAKAKSWIPEYYSNFNWEYYYGSEPINTISFTQGQMATIILPTTPDASKGKYYRLDRCENGQVVFEQEANPQARTPYIIVPSLDFNIDWNSLVLEDLYTDTVSIDGISFVGSYRRENLSCQEGYYIDIIDSTPDCLGGSENLKKAIVGALRACLIVSWDDPYAQGGSRGVTDKLTIILQDNPNGMESIHNSRFIIHNDDAIYDLQGCRLSGKPAKGIYIQNGAKRVVR